MFQYWGFRQGTHYRFSPCLTSPCNYDQQHARSLSTVLIKTNLFYCIFYCICTDHDNKTFNYLHACLLTYLFYYLRFPTTTCLSDYIGDSTWDFGACCKCAINASDQFSLLQCMCVLTYASVHFISLGTIEWFSSVVHIADGSLSHWGGAGGIHAFYWPNLRPRSLCC